MPESDLIKITRKDPLTETELAETRITNHKVLREMVDPDEIKIWQQKTDDLWWALGWVPQTLTNRKALVAAIILALFIGGRELIGNITTFLAGLLP